jgi:hypothetical protein
MHLHLAMRRFSFGPSYGIPAESLRYTEVAALAPCKTRTPVVRATKELRDAHRMGIFSIDARICTEPSALCWRIQDITIARRQNVSFILSQHSIVRVCAHLETPKYNFFNVINSHVKNYPHGTLTKAGECNICNTSWELELRDLGENDVCLALTRWWDLGPGLSPDDHRWTTYVDFVVLRPMAATGIAGSTRARFEASSVKTSGSSSELLTDEELYIRNTSLLKSKRYKRVLKPWGRNWWFIQGEEPLLNSVRCILI